jgi:hypothetical protein
MERLEATYVNRAHRFYRKNQGFQRQYYHIYESRLRQLHDLLKEKVVNKFGK